MRRARITKATKPSHRTRKKVRVNRKSVVDTSTLSEKRVKVDLKPGRFTFSIDPVDGAISVSPAAVATPTKLPKLDYAKIDRFLHVTEEVVTNEAGAKQTRVPYGLQYMPPFAVLETSKVMHEGTTKYGKGNWRNIPIDEHLNHAVGHILQWWAGRRTDGPVAELSHAACRILFALEAAIIEASGATSSQEVK